MSKKKARSKSILRQQKPRKRRSSRRRRAIFTLGFLLLLGVSTAVTYSLYEQTSKFVSKQIAAQNTNDHQPWSIELASDTDKPLPDKYHQQILKIASKHLKTGDKDELLSIAGAVRNSGLFGHVGVKNYARGKIAISYKRRQPVAKVETGYLLSSSGQIYSSRTEHFGADEHIVLSGIWEPESRPKSRRDRSLVLSSKQMNTVTEMEELIELMSKVDLSVRGIHFVAFRGFELTMNHQEIKVAIGMSPFATKLDRLKRILEAKPGESSTISRIELDYQGKAFIKRRKS